MSKQMKQYEVLKWASLFLEKNNCEQQVGEILLQHHLNVSRSQFFMMMQDEVPEEVIRAFKKDINEHCKTGIPVQHLTGYEYFYGRKFIVNEHVLIPRPETEELVQHVIQQVKGKQVTIVDVGTGSGVIAITLALELPEASVIATDISKRALTVAKENAARLQAPVKFKHGSFLQPLIDSDQKVDIVVSNPPYIANSDRQTLSRTVEKFDPELALFADDHGLAAYKEIINEAQFVVDSHGVLAFEIGDDQGESVQQLIKRTFPNSKTNLLQDINKKNRIVIATL